MSQTDTKSQISQKEILDLKEAHLKEKKLLENELQNAKKQASLQADQFQEKINELELRIKLSDSESSKDISVLREALDQSEVLRVKLTGDIKNMDSQKLKAIKETEDRFTLLIKGLDDQIEELKETHGKEIKDLQLKSETALRQLREFYESEKTRLEKRLVEDKEKGDRKYGQIIEEYEIRIREETNNYEDEIENLKDELRDHEVQSQSLMQQFENELDLRQKNIENLEKLLKETKDNLNKLQENNKGDIENLTTQFTYERNGWNEKLENLMKEINNKEKEILTLRQRIEMIEGTIGKKEEIIEGLKREVAGERSDGGLKLEELRNK